MDGDLTALFRVYHHKKDYIMVFTSVFMISN